MPLKVDYKLIAVQFSKTNTTYFYKVPKHIDVDLGNRVIVAQRDSYSIPTVVGVYPAGSTNETGNEDWIVQVVDRTYYEELKRLEALP